MHGQQEDERVLWVLICLYLFQHGLSFLQENESFLIAFLRDEIDSTLIKFIDDNWDLVLVKVEIFIIISLKGVFDTFVSAHSMSHDLVNVCYSDVAHIALPLFLVFPAKHLAANGTVSRAARS